MNSKHLYRFGDFELYTDENVLHRDGTGVSLTPKMFDLLRVLVRNAGELLDKETLLREVWPDSFVEEGNIAFNIRQLRKLLGDDAQSPIYIETVPRRGYRFIASVEEVAGERSPTSPAAIENLPRRFATPEPVPVKSQFHVFLPVFILFVCLVGGAAYLVLSRSTASLPIFSQPFESEKLSASGSVYGAAISPDGKTVVYSTRTGDKQSLWLRQLDSANNVAFIPPSNESYYDFVFSPDSRFVYFSRSANDVDKPNIYRVAILGGIPDRVVSGAEVSFSISPDGTRISFVRCPRTAEEWCSLWTADAKDGSNEKKLISRQDPNRIGDNEFSPDGRKIAFAVGQSRDGSNDFQLMELDLTSGTERALTPEKFFNIKSIAWLPDQSGLLATASRIPTHHFRIWHISVAAGAAEPLTKDSEMYSLLSIDREGRSIISTQIKDDFGIYIFSIDEASAKRFVANGLRGVYAPGDKFFYASSMSGNNEVWGMNVDGSGQRQLTNDPGADGAPVTSSDGKKVFFVSNRSGQAHVWQMNADGTNQAQVTTKQSGSPLAVSPDGKLLYFSHALHGNLWSVSLENGEEKLVLDRPHNRFAVSADAAAVSFRTDPMEGGELSVISLSNGETLHSHKIPKEKRRILSVAWMPDGKSFLYLTAGAAYESGAVYRQVMGGGPPQQIIDLKDEQLSEIATISISPDGKHISAVLGDWRHDAVRIRGLK